MTELNEGRIKNHDVGRIFYEKGLAYTAKAKKFKNFSWRFVWVHEPKKDAVRGDVQR